MQGYGPDTYGELMAPIYDRLYPAHHDVGPATDLLAELAGTGQALELGIGTGRIALPLRERGVPVCGIDASPAMVDQLRAKPGGDQIPVTIADFGHQPLTSTAVPGPFALVYVVFNTLFGLLTQREQVACFAAVADCLTGDGCFVVEAFVPDPARFSHAQALMTSRVESDRLLLTASRHDRNAQVVDTQVIGLDPDLGTGDGKAAATDQRGGVPVQARLYPVTIRYAFPAELDLMAQLAGLRLHERWGDWRRTPFTNGSASHVSVYRR